jgi:hypothetical protein
MRKFLIVRGVIDEWRPAKRPGGGSSLAQIFQAFTTDGYEAAKIQANSCLIRSDDAGLRESDGYLGRKSAR